MSLTNAQKQSAHRARRTAKLERMEGALNAISAKLDGNDKPLAAAIREMAKEGLGQ